MNFELPPTAIDQPELAVNYLAGASSLSKGIVKDAMKKGAVWLTQDGRKRRLRRAKSMLKAGDEVSFYYSLDILNTTPEQPTLVADEQDFSVWIKPAGVTSGGTRFADHCAIDRIIEKRLDRPCFLVHRLDRFAWGLMVVAHGKKSAADLSRQFQARLVRKHYEAIVIGELIEPVTIDAAVDNKAAISHVSPLTSNGIHSSVRVNIETGRKHQIRQHLSSLGYPILGDRQYGGYHGDQTSEANQANIGMQLAAVELAFQSMSGDTHTYRLDAELSPQLPD